MTEQEKTLIGGCVKGDKSSWDEFVRQYSNLVYHTLRKTLTLHHVDQRDDTVEDLYQDVFISLLADDCRKLKQFRGDGGCTLASWLRMIAARRTIDHLRKLKPETQLVAATSDDYTDGPGDTAFAHQLVELLAQAVISLPARERFLIDLFYRHNLSTQDVASLLQMTVGAVYTQKSRILGKLREILNKSILL